MAVRRSLWLVALLLSSACSGAASTELFGPSSTDTNATEPVSGSNDDAATSSSSGGSSSSGATSDGSSGSDGSDGTDGSSGDTGAPPPPPNACTTESEPNDDRETTEWFTECFSGTLAKGDIDYASVSAPNDAKDVTISHHESGGGVRYRLFINGVALTSFSNDPPKYIPVFPGGTYMLEMSPSGSSNATRAYEVRVKFE